MPDIVDTAQTGAPAATPEVEQVAPVEQQETQNSAPETEEEKQERSRDEKGRFQSRLNEITRARREAERTAERNAQERDFYRQQVEAYQRQGQTPQNNQPRNDMPTPEDFGYDLAQWGQAVTEKLRSEAMQSADQRFQQQTMQQQQVQVFSQFEEKERAYAQSNPEYFDRVEQLTSVVNFNPVVGEILATSDHGPALVDYLAQHLYEADQLSRMPPHLAAVQLGRIEAQLAQHKPKPVSGAPAPPPKINGSAAGSKDPEKMTSDEWMRWRQTQL